MMKDVGMVVPKLEKQDQQMIHTRQCQTNNITLYSSEFRVHATTKMNYNSCMQTRDNCMQQ